MTSLICTRARRSLPMHREEPHRRVSTIYLFCTRQACDYGTVLARERGLSWPKHQRCPTLLFLLEYPLGLSLMSCSSTPLGLSKYRWCRAFRRTQRSGTSRLHFPSPFCPGTGTKRNGSVGPLHHSFFRQTFVPRRLHGYRHAREAITLTFTPHMS